MSVTSVWVELTGGGGLQLCIIRVIMGFCVIR